MSPGREQLSLRAPWWRWFWREAMPRAWCTPHPLGHRLARPLLAAQLRRERDFADVIDGIEPGGFAFTPAWFAPHFSFRFPHIGDISAAGVQISLRAALEPGM